ncbi:MAG: calcium/sodium antiporter [bacterium]|nr:calcium/sodium antiporter [bacterium]
MAIFLLILGLGGLWLGSELTVRGALNIANHYKLSQAFTGLAILALGTDLPELFVDITGAIDRLAGIETSDIIIGETIGTSFSQIGLILGIVALFGTLHVTKRILWRDGATMIASVALLFLMSLDGEFSRVEGIILVMLYIGYLAALYREERVSEKISGKTDRYVIWSGLSLAGGMAVLIYSSVVTIDNALILSEQFGISQSLVGILIVGLGTSLPELATSITAIRKKAGTLAVGNLIGSNIYDVLFTLGIGTTISGFIVSEGMMRFDIPLLFIFSLIVILLFARKKNIDKKEGMFLIGLYLFYFFIKIGTAFF